jgi:hypothetical protein
VIKIRVADADDLAQLPVVEAAADELFVRLGITDLPPPAPVAQRAHAWRVLVAGRLAGTGLRRPRPGRRGGAPGTVVGAPGRWPARLAAFLQGPRPSLRGVGAGRSFRYADVPWNAPFYARHGWQPALELTPGLRAMRAREADLGLDRHGPRIVMVRPVGAAPTG